LCKIRRTSSHAINIARTWSGSSGGAKRNLPTKAAPECAVVVRETVVVATFEPSMGEEGGETEHVEAIGAPVHVHVIV
jgi:hypothetical protein